MHRTDRCLQDDVSVDAHDVFLSSHGVCVESQRVLFATNVTILSPYAVFSSADVVSVAREVVFVSDDAV
jgi:hypothetical protein